MSAATDADWAQCFAELRELGSTVETIVRRQVGDLCSLENEEGCGISSSDITHRQFWLWRANGRSWLKAIIELRETLGDE